MRALPLVFALAVLPGCGTQRTLEQDIAAASNIDLCEVYLYGTPAMTEVTTPEVIRRNIDCRQLDQAIVQRQQLRAQAANRPVPTYTPYQIPMPPPIQSRQTTCTSQRIGNQVQTICR